MSDGNGGDEDGEGSETFHEQLSVGLRIGGSGTGPGSNLRAGAGRLLPGTAIGDKGAVVRKQQEIWTAQFRPDDKSEFETAASGKLPEAGDDQVNIQCYNGPPDAEHWIRFDGFRISKLAEEEGAGPSVPRRSAT